ncbi:hypothetical protein OH77DRAFT_1422055 [Trametes cingulata]|nr:hypothetical protein OH77DRAFT_1422055 [Trametes cingulata]
MVQRRQCLLLSCPQLCRGIGSSAVLHRDICDTRDTSAVYVLVTAAHRPHIRFPTCLRQAATRRQALGPRGYKVGASHHRCVAFYVHHPDQVAPTLAAQQAASQKGSASTSLEGACQGNVCGRHVCAISVSTTGTTGDLNSSLRARLPCLHDSAPRAREARYSQRQVSLPDHVRRVIRVLTIRFVVRRNVDIRFIRRRYREKRLRVRLTVRAQAG